ncbi:Beta/Gamma crystallin [Maioricimonas rarisocia]|uniref:Beta/Gamma crystallin n=1 Tax=Maioricimonas rarisocia TaxID=2528026 RepID=A0A517Z2W1_9PLAN|nr:beta/gamma crystallin-related protein [Maioricimonas rarisocia]QDU36834.1 Beta/Gamma crystallin [Maioricimonas rarisocia]
MKELILFKGDRFRGVHIHVFSQGENSLADCDFDNDTRSVVVVNGFWKFYSDPEFERPFQLGEVDIELGVGEYTEEQLRDNGIEPSQVSSVRPA